MPQPLGTHTGQITLDVLHACTYCIAAAQTCSARWIRLELVKPMSLSVMRSVDFIPSAPTYLADRSTLCATTLTTKGTARVHCQRQGNELDGLFTIPCYVLMICQFLTIQVLCSATSLPYRSYLGSINDRRPL